MKVISSHGGYYAMHVVEDDFKCVSWKGWNWKKWHLGIFAMTRHGITLVGVVSNVDNKMYSFWNHGGWDIFYRDSYDAPVADILHYQYAEDDFLECVKDALEYWDSDWDYEVNYE